MKKPHFTKTTLPEPKRPENLPDYAQWLSGEGAGSWFVIEKIGNDYEITRFLSEGVVECKGVFISKTPNFNHLQSYQFTYLSHCKEVNIIQSEIIYTFEHI